VIKRPSWMPLTVSDVFIHNSIGDYSMRRFSVLSSQQLLHGKVIM
jgi:hypothetical protein